MTALRRSRSAEVVHILSEEIRAGVLKPGDRVPSTREITRRWSVAMATATKALGTLKAEGLVQTVPGVGTVVARPAARSRAVPRTSGRTAGPGAPPPDLAPLSGAGARVPGAGGELDRRSITEVAMLVADQEGLSAVSMRRVAAELGVATMSLYRHVVDKDDLLDQMLDLATRELPRPDLRAEEHWRDALSWVARGLWAGFRRHPWLGPAISITRPQPVPGGMAYTDHALRALTSAGFDPAESLSLHLVLMSFVRGLGASLEAETLAEAETGLTAAEWVEQRHGQLQTVLAAGSMPAMAEVVDGQGGGFHLELDALFETGLRVLLDGFERQSLVT